VLPEVNQILAAVVTTVTFKGPVLAVEKTHVVAYVGRKAAGKSCHTEGIYSDSHDCACGLAVAAPWQISWNSENTGNAADPMRSGAGWDGIKELGVVGKHAPAGGTGHHLLLGVAAEVLSKLVAVLEGAGTAWEETPGQTSPQPPE
jgi:hypothetical protein